jgi:hypothetical protein
VQHGAHDIYGKAVMRKASGPAFSEWGTPVAVLYGKRGGAAMAQALDSEFLFPSPKPGRKPRYSQAKLEMLREALGRLDRQANERSLGTAQPN